MKHGWCQKGLYGVVVLSTAVTLVSVFSGSVPAATDEWPMRFKDQKGEVVMYQPQLEDFKDDKISGRAAVSVTSKEFKEPLFGAVWLEGRVSVDRDSRTAKIYEARVTDVKFPSARADQQEKVKKFLNEEIEGDVHTIALDRLVAAMDLLEKQRAVDENLNNNPPRIIYRNQPAVLVLLDGEPKLMPITDSTLMRVVNTPFLMVYAAADKTYYLKAGDTWVSSFVVEGPYSPLASLPTALREFEEKMKLERERIAKARGADAGREREMEAERKVELEKGALPEIVVSTEPAELIVTEGEPQFTPIEGTNLLYVSNSENNIFMDTTSQQYYVLLSGRWFGAMSLQDGPWSYVPSTSLPADFAKIPEGSIKGFVLVSVAGTQQAKEAVMDTYIPQTALIDRKNATIEIKYDGLPRFEAIPNTKVEYAVNTQDAVFKVSDKYYACVQAVWYESTSPNGPWKVSVEVAGELYSIPPSNPHYNSRYVKVYDSTEDTARVGYTPGYTGSYVQNDTVVYGTGYSYPAYSSPTSYVPYPSTYGYSAIYDPYASAWGYQPAYYNPYSWLVPTIVGIGAAIVMAAIVDDWWDDNYYHPYYGGWWGWGGYRYHNIYYIHHYHYPNWRWDRRRPPYWRPGDRPDWRPDRPWHRDRRLHRDIPLRPGDRPDWRPRRAGEPLDRFAGLPYQRSNLYKRPGMENKVVDDKRIRPAGTERLEERRAPERRDRGRLETRPSDERRRSVEPTGKRQKPAEQMKKNNVFTDREGNVYRRDNRGNWQERGDRGWSNLDQSDRRQVRPPSRDTGRSPRPEVTRPTPRSSMERNNLDREFRARERGAQRSYEFRRSQEFRPPPSAGRPRGGSDGSTLQRGGSSNQGGRSNLQRGGDSSSGGFGGGRSFGGDGGGRGGMHGGGR